MQWQSWLFATKSTWPIKLKLENSFQKSLPVLVIDHALLGQNSRIQGGYTHPVWFFRKNYSLFAVAEGWILSWRMAVNKEVMAELENPHFDSSCETTNSDKDHQLIIKSLWKVIMGKIYSHIMKTWCHKLLANCKKKKTYSVHKGEMLWSLLIHVVRFISKSETGGCGVPRNMVPGFGKPPSVKPSCWRCTWSHGKINYNSCDFQFAGNTENTGIRVTQRVSKQPDGSRNQQHGKILLEY